MSKVISEWVHVMTFLLPFEYYKWWSHLKVLNIFYLCFKVLFQHLACKFYKSWGRTWDEVSPVNDANPRYNIRMLFLMLALSPPKMKNWIKDMYYTLAAFSTIRGRSVTFHMIQHFHGMFSSSDGALLCHKLRSWRRRLVLSKGLGQWYVTEQNSIQLLRGVLSWCVWLCFKGSD